MCGNWFFKAYDSRDEFNSVLEKLVTHMLD